LRYSAVAAPPLGDGWVCELLAMSSRVPATVGLSLKRLARRGGAEGPHRDGWGAAFYEGPDLFLVREAHAACESPLMHLLESQGRRSCMVVCHVRLATCGARALRNTQPFARELAGRMHTFAHNGHLPGLCESLLRRPIRFTPVGDTDSELAFCVLLESMVPLWADPDRVPSLASRLEAIAAAGDALRRFGPANFIYGDSTTLFIHADRRTQTDGSLRPPGLHLLQRACWQPGPELAEAGVSIETVRQDVALVASVPLTDELWRPLRQGEVLALVGGHCVDRDGHQAADFMGTTDEFIMPV
jgi:predicted glutamine amidotransferase